MEFYTWFSILLGKFIYYKRIRRYPNTYYDYVRSRRTRNFFDGDDESGMYERLSMSNDATSFEPPSLPPPPSAYVDPSFA